MHRYLKAKLGISVGDYCILKDLPYRTLSDRWKSGTGKAHTIHEVFRTYMEIKCKVSVKRFDAL